MATNAECCAALGGYVSQDDEGQDVCEMGVNSPQYANIPDLFYLSEACSYADAQNIQVSSGGGGFNFGNFADGLSDILDSVGGLLGGFAGLGSVPNPQTATQSQLDAARQTRVILGFVILLSLIVLGVVLSRRKR